MQQVTVKRSKLPLVWKADPSNGDFVMSKIGKNFEICAMAKKEKKPRADKYNEKLAINGTFADVIKVSVKPFPQPEPKPEKVEKKSAKKGKK